MQPRDTSDAAHPAQVRVWQRMTPGERVELAARMSDDVRAIARSGISARHPDYSAQDLEHALRRLYLGDALFQGAWPDAPLLAP